MADVVVIGGGLAGSLAALEAQRLGAKVAVARRGYGATAMSTGAIDIAYSPALSPAYQVPRTLAEHVMDIIAHRPRHPYGVLGLETSLGGIRDGYALLVKALAGGGLDLAPLDLQAENVGFASSLGAGLPAAAACGAHGGLDLNHPTRGRWGIVQLAGDGAFDARRVALGIAQDAHAMGNDAVVFDVVPVSFGECASPLDLARLLDDQSAVDTLASALTTAGATFDGLVVPPVVGLRQHRITLARLREKVGKPVVEALGHIPSVPGLRLQLALDEALAAAGIERLDAVVQVCEERGVLQAVRTQAGRDVSAGAYVLATGRFIAGGITWDDDGCREAILGLPVVTESGPMEVDSPHSVVRETPMDSHPLMTAGVLCDADLRPQREAVPAYENLFAAGMILGGFASRYALCADGVAMASAVHAARQACLCAGGEG